MAKRYISRQISKGKLVCDNFTYGIKADEANNKKVSIYINDKNQIMVVKKNLLTGSLKLLYYKAIETSSVSKRVSPASLILTYPWELNTVIKNAHYGPFLYGELHREDGPSDINSVFGEYSYSLDDHGTSREKFLLNIYNNEDYGERVRAAALVNSISPPKNKIVDLRYLGYKK